MKNRFLSMLIGAVLFVLSAAAENYPYRSDVLWVTVPDHADWLYKTGEKAKIEVQFYKYGIPQDGVEVLYELGGDMMPSDTKGVGSVNYYGDPRVTGLKKSGIGSVKSK